MANEKHVHLFVLDTMADWEPGFAVAYIQSPGPGVAPKYRVKTVGFTREPIRTQGGVTILPDLALADLRPADSALLLLPGAALWQEARVEPALNKAREFEQAGVLLAAICGATFGLARAGLLDNRRHTSNDPEYLASSGYKGRSLYSRELVVEDRGVVTASSVAALEFARLLLQKLEVYQPDALTAWYGLFKTGEPAFYGAWMQALQRSAT